ncbi:hypothetical protein ABW20_dc0109853 [Dactylellina cionopaga]|nr:hypothetical protein ABW20_dc0109853 [Dactylellina cionopaga]
MSVRINKTEIAIYTEFRDIFRDDKAYYRKRKKIVDVLNESATAPRVKDFCAKKKINKIELADILKILLDAQVFESLAKAKLRFPTLFQLSLEQLKLKENRESEAAESEAGVIAASIQGDLVPEPENKDGRRDSGISCPPTPPPLAIILKPSIFDPPVIEASPTTQPTKPTNNIELSVADTVKAKMPNLFPVYLPYIVQHTLTTEAQRILENACYDHAKQWFPDCITQEQFQHPENAELPMWCRLIKKKHKSLIEDAYNTAALGPKSLKGTIGSLENLRHTAVHRLKTHSKGLEDLLQNAVRFSKYLKDEQKTDKLEEILEKAKELSTNLENEKILLRNNLEKELEEIEEMRRELRRREEQALKDIIEDDKMARNAITLIFPRAIGGVRDADTETEGTEVGTSEIQSVPSDFEEGGSLGNIQGDENELEGMAEVANNDPTSLEISPFVLWEISPAPLEAPPVLSKAPPPVLLERPSPVPLEIPSPRLSRHLDIDKTPPPALEGPGDNSNRGPGFWGNIFGTHRVAESKMEVVVLAKKKQKREKTQKVEDMKDKEGEIE